MGSCAGQAGRTKRDERLIAVDQLAREKGHGAKGDHDIVLRFVWQLSQEGAEVSQLHDVVLQLADVLLSMLVLQQQFMDDMRSPCSNGGTPSEGEFPHGSSHLASSQVIDPIKTIVCASVAALR